MITTTTRFTPGATADGTLHDPDPRRRARRLRDAGVVIEHDGLLARTVRFPDGTTRSARSARGAELRAHAFLDARRRG